VSQSNPFGALGTRGQEDLGRGGVGVLIEKVMFDLPCVVDAEFVCEFDLIECFLKEVLFGVVVPGSRQLVFVEDAEFHPRALFLSE
jgi:hypothetical protein